MQVKSVLLTVGIGAVAGAATMLLIPRHSEAYRLADDAARKLTAWRTTLPTASSKAQSASSTPCAATDIWAGFARPMRNCHDSCPFTKTVLYYGAESTNEVLYYDHKRAPESLHALRLL